MVKAQKAAVSPKVDPEQKPPVVDPEQTQEADPLETAQAEIEELKAIINEQAAKITEQEATIANMMADVAAMVEAGPAKAPASVVEYEGQAYKMCSKVVLVDNTSLTAEDLQANPKLIGKILAVKGQKTLIPSA